MQLLIVHHDAELGEQLVQMVKEYTSHTCNYAGNDKGAIEWARKHAKCALLITQLEGEGVDGLTLGGTLSEIFPGLQTMFLPPYRGGEQRLKVVQTKVFPEPIDGEALLEAITRAEAEIGNRTDYFDVIDVLQMCCLSRRSGAIQMVTGNKSGIAYLRQGQIIHAETASMHGKSALEEIVSWQLVEFAYDRTVRAPLETISLPWHEVLIDAVAPQRPQSAA